MANQRQSLYLFGSLEVHRTAYSGTTYTIDDKTLVPYLMSNGVRLARLHYETTTTVPQVAGTGLTDELGKTNTAATLHVLLELGDHLGSTGTVLDKVSSELVEKTGYLPFGARENDYRPSRWNGFREDYGFTGKEEDVQVGLVYFGKRYLSPQLGRWLSPDPLAVHAPGKADFNLYAYVSGAVLKNVDPVGLDDAEENRVNDIIDGEFSQSKVESVRAMGSAPTDTGLRVKVVEAVSGKPVGGARVIAHGESATASTDKSGVAVLQGASSVDRIDVEQDEFTTTVVGEAKAGDDLTVAVSRRLDTMTVKRDEPDLLMGDFGHYWIELGPRESYGLYPSANLSDVGHSKKSAISPWNGLGSSVNAEWAKGTPMRDAHHNAVLKPEMGDTQFQPYVASGANAHEVRQVLRGFQEHWDPRTQYKIPVTDCQTFQRDMMRAGNLMSPEEYGAQVLFNARW